MYLGKDHGWLLKPSDKTDEEPYNEWIKLETLELLINLNIRRRKNQTLWASCYDVIGSAQHHLRKIVAKSKLKSESDQAFSCNQQFTGNTGIGEHFKQQHGDTLSQILQNK